MKVKTSELQGAALDWAAILAEGHLGRMNNAGKDVDTARALLARIPK